MALFLDSARVEDAKRANRLEFVEGITTNPHLIRETGRPGLEVLAELVTSFDGHVFYQIRDGGSESRLDDAWRAYDIRPDRVVIMVPASLDNLALIPMLSGVTIAVTAIFSAAQAYLAAQAGADYVMPYIQRSHEKLGESDTLIRDICAVVAGTETEILAANIVSVEQALMCVQAGAHHITVPMAIINAMGEHELSREVMQEAR